MVKELLNTLYLLKHNIELIPMGGGGGVLIFGTGAATLLYQEAFRREGIYPSHYIDNNKEKIGKKYGDSIIISPEKISNDKVVLVCINDWEKRKEVENQLSKLGCAFFHVDEYILGKHADDIEQVLSLLDDESKVCYCEVLLKRLKNVEIKHCYPDIYFGIPEFNKKNRKEIFIDCGAYVGDIVEEYIQKRQGVFGKIYAIEPNITTYKAMKIRLNRLSEEWAIEKNRIIAMNCAVGEKRDISCLHLENGQLGATLNNDNSEESNVQIEALDELMSESKVDFIKADIEGFEYSMLLGAKNIISRYSPRLAICIYHNSSDLYSIPLLIKNLNSNYKIKIRHHGFNLGDTVLYAYV